MNGGALEHASAELRADREVVLAAVQMNGWALVFASAELRADRAVVLAAVQRLRRAPGFWRRPLRRQGRRPGCWGRSWLSCLTLASSKKTLLWGQKKFFGDGYKLRLRDHGRIPSTELVGVL